jgi:hypothetical protein
MCLFPNALINSDYVSLDRFTSVAHSSYGKAETRGAHAPIPEYRMLSLIARQKEICPVRVQGK